MNSGTDAADQIVNMSLRGIEVIAKITGLGAKNLATYLSAVLRDQKRTKGKTRLEGLLRSGKELKVFAVKHEDLKKFCEESKRYGVLYCALRDIKEPGGDVATSWFGQRTPPRSTGSSNGSSWRPSIRPASRAKSRSPELQGRRKKKLVKRQRTKKRLPRKARPPKRARTIFWMRS
jgi:hypothetical protein